MNYTIVKTGEEIDELVDEAWETAADSLYPDWSFEDGVIAMYNWLVGNVVDAPMFDE